jgi:hypothetical protein
MEMLLGRLIGRLMDRLIGRLIGRLMGNMTVMERWLLESSGRGYGKTD